MDIKVFSGWGNRVDIKVFSGWGNKLDKMQSPQQVLVLRVHDRKTALRYSTNLGRYRIVDQNNDDFA